MLGYLTPIGMFYADTIFYIFETSFKNDFRNTKTFIEKIKLQETLAKVSVLLLENNGDTSALRRDNELSYENCKAKEHNGLVVGQFRYSRGLLVSCVVDNGSLILLRNGFHDICD